MCTLTAFVWNYCFLILYWWDKGKLLCSYNIRRGIHELLCSRPAFSLCLVLPWALYGMLLVVWRALTMRKTWPEDMSGISQAFFLPVLTYEEEDSSFAEVCSGWLGSHISLWVECTLYWRQEPGPNHFIWLLLNLEWGGNVGSVFLSCSIHASLYPNDRSPFHK